MPDLKIKDNCLGYYEEGKFIVLCNFYFEPFWQIQTGKKSGYVANVYIQGEPNPRLCYYSNEDAQTVNTFTAALNRSFGGGLLTRKEFKTMFEDHIFEITFEFKQKAQREGRAFKYEAASCCGLQPDGDAYVLNRDVHLDREGNLIERDARKYMWLGDAAGPGVPGFIANPEDGARVSLPLAETYTPLFHLLKSMKACLHNNFLAGFFSLSAGLMCHNYEAVLRCWSLFPVPILVGDVNRGKSTALLCAIAPYGQDESSIFNGQSFAWLTKYASKRNINPFGIEDLDDIKDIKQLVKTFYQSNVRATNSSEDKPKTAPLM